MSAEGLDKSWPNPLPTIDDVRGVFEDELGSIAAHYDDDPERRIDTTKALLLRGQRGPYDQVRRRLHKLLSVQGFNNDPRLSGRLVQRGFAGPSPFVQFNGLDFVQDVQRYVLPSLRAGVVEVMVSDEPIQARLDKLASTTGVLTAEAQTLSNGNTRVARAIHDYIQRGPSELDMDRIANGSLHFTPPQSIENLLMEQNAARLIDHPDGDPYGDEGISAFSARAQDMMTEASLDMSRFLDPETLNYPEFNKQLQAVLPADEDQTAAVKRVFMQKKYSVAAWTVAFLGEKPLLPLSQEDAQKLIEANYDLLRMRVAGLALGTLRGGDFVSIAQDGDHRDRGFNHDLWWPSASY